MAGAKRRKPQMSKTWKMERKDFVRTTRLAFGLGISMKKKQMAMKAPMGRLMKKP
jgi:hypothetical protein